ncbi:Hypothetical protein EAG7_04735 [Klebsiella aerogenes]|nr:Hypothetical protein EAG7_04735 [Klebsiella aerogenes]CCG33226.1 hypothetical protein [Klebsiella aerogenes EA1509E]
MRLSEVEKAIKIHRFWFYFLIYAKRITITVSLKKPAAKAILSFNI